MQGFSTDGEQVGPVAHDTYAAPETLGEALALLQQYGEEAKVIAGGQSLLVFLRKGLLAPELLLDLKRIPELRTSAFAPGEGMVLGAMVTQAALERSPEVRAHYLALADAAAVVASPQVRNQGTLGGNLCHADPTADPPAALIALGATLEIAGPEGTRTLPVETFFRDFMEVDLHADEILTRIFLPAPTPTSGSVYLKHRLRQVDTAIVGVAAWLQLDGTQIRDVRLGLAGAGVTPLRAAEAEVVLRGQPLSGDLSSRAAAIAADHCEPLDDTEASEWYRREMVRTFVARALPIAAERAQTSAARSS